MASSNSVNKVIETLGKVAKTVLEWKTLNAVAYDVSKTEAVFFSNHIGSN